MAKCDAGALGIEAQPLTLELAEAFGIESRSGVIIGRVQEDSPADKAGLRAGDVIMAIDGRPVRDVRAVRNRIGLVRLGEELDVQIVRDRETRVIQVTVEELPKTNPLKAGASLLEQQSINGRLYVVIESVRPGSIIDRAGLRSGDIILAINRQGVGTIADIEEIVGKAGEELLLLIQRDRSTRYVRLPNG